MPRYGIIPFYNDETATAMDEPVIFLDTIPTEITREMMQEALKSCTKESDFTPYGVPIADMDQWSTEKLAQAMWDVACLIFDSAAIVPEEKFEDVREAASIAWQSFGSDSSTYRACAAFNRTLKSVAVSVIPFPCSDSDAFFGDMA